MGGKGLVREVGAIERGLMGGSEDSSDPTGGLT